MSVEHGESKKETATSKTPKDKFESWKKLTLSERLNRVGSSVQKVKDGPYSLDTYRCEPKFEVGDPVAVCCQGLYYHAVIQNIEDPYECPDLKKKVPLYSVKYPGWGDKGTDELIVEYDVVGTTKHTVAHELLYAHYWNKSKTMDRKIKKNQLKGIFELPHKTLAKLENKWVVQIKRENPEQDLTFSQWIGLDAAP